MNKAQEEAFSKVRELMGEHFPASVIVTETEVEGKDKKLLEILYQGGYTCALGLIRRADHMLINDEEPDDE